MSISIETWVFGSIASVPIITFFFQLIGDEKKARFQRFWEKILDFWSNRKNISIAARGYYSKSKFILEDVWTKSKIDIILVLVFVLLGRVINFALPVCNKIIVDEVVQKNFCWPLIILVFFLKIVDTARDQLCWRSYWKVEKVLCNKVEKKLFNHSQDLKWEVRAEKKSGEIGRIIRRSSYATWVIACTMVFDIVPSILDLTIGAFYFLVEFRGFSLIFVTSMVVYTVANVWLSDRHTKLIEMLHEVEKEADSIQSDSINNHQTVKYFVAEKYESERYGKYVDELKNRNFAADVYGLKMTFSQRSIIDVFISIATLLAAYAAFSGNDFTAGDFVLFTTYLVQLYNPFYKLGYAYRRFKKALIDMKKMFDFLDEEVEQDDEDAQDLPEIQCSITFNKVKFGYAEEKLILDGVDFTINAGETVALVGPSGSGKSTLYRLLLRFFEVKEGSIEIGGVNIRKISRKSLRKHFGIVSQDIELFNNTIEYNIRYGDLEASQEQVEEASKAAAIHDFIMSHSDGYSTQVGQKGIKLSGGEKQRVSIARAILKKPQYILLDEATSALDNQTEKAIQNNLNELCKSRTSLIIAHRLTTVTHANRIFVLEKGKIVESGNHKELLKMKGVYYDMWEQHNK